MHYNTAFYRHRHLEHEGTLSLATTKKNLMPLNVLNVEQKLTRLFVISMSIGGIVLSHELIFLLSFWFFFVALQNFVL